jgi:hypothetical protein
MTSLIDAVTEREQVAPYLTSSPIATGSTARYGAGTVLAKKYRLDSVLGVGAMGAVWQATNLLLDAPVAIKLAHAELAGSAFRARLQLEARAAASFVHPGIVRVFDVGETDAGDPFIVMELLQGATLAQMTSQGGLSAVRAVQIVLPVIDALAAMHARGVVHRDVKPDNLFVALEEQRVQPKIVDFGIAISSDPGGAPRARDDGGVLVGSPEYMSPEQAEASEDIDHRTDIWSICVVLYEAIAGETPFNASHAMLLLRAIIMDEPVSLTDRGVADERLWEIVRVGLSKDRENRHASMSELGKELARWLLDRGVHEDVCGTSLLSKWFADDEAALAGTNAFQLAAQRRAEVAAFVRTTPPRSVRSPKGPERRRGRAARGRWVRAAKVCTVTGVMALAFFATNPKNAMSALVASRAFGQHRVTDPIAWSPLPSRDEARTEAASVQAATALPLASAPRAQNAIAAKLAADRGAVSAVQRKPHANAPLRKVQVVASRADLDLIAPY